MRRPSTRDLLLCRLLIIIGSLTGLVSSGRAQEVVLHLLGGDRLTGTLLSQTTNSLVLSNRWISELTVPQDQIVRWTTNSTAVAGGEIPDLALTSKESLSVDSLWNGYFKTNGWRREAQVGLDLLYGGTDRQIVHGRLKLGYQRPYNKKPDQFFRNMFDFTAEYGRTEGVESSDRMYATDKLSFDLRNRWYVYGLVGGGYDDPLKINAQYEAGPGLGYHLFTLTNYLMNVEAGVNYQAQFREVSSSASTNGVGSDVQDVYYRLAEEFAWKIRRRTMLMQRCEVFPNVNLTGMRLRFESTLSYELWKNIALNLTVLDLYDTNPAEDVGNNELQVRSALGVKF